MGLLALGARLGMFPFHIGAKTLVGVTVLCGVGIAGVATLWVADGREVLWRRARRIAIGAALVAVPIVAGQALARMDYYVAREIQARAIIDALAALRRTGASSTPTHSKISWPRETSKRFPRRRSASAS